MKATRIGVAVGVAIAIAATTASACTKDYPSGANQLVPARVDQGLLDATVRAEVNYHRCRAGLRRLGPAQSALVQIAATHSRWMAQSGNLSHRSTVRGQKSLTERIRAANVAAQKGAENIGMVHRYRIDGQHFRILDSASCSFASRSGERLPAHSYASLAQHAVGLWMDSAGHRRNILDPDVTHVSTAAAFGEGQYCGQFWLTQNFVG
jgi:uncharacterized protein YkwD